MDNKNNTAEGTCWKRCQAAILDQGSFFLSEPQVLAKSWQISWSSRSPSRDGNSWWHYRYAQLPRICWSRCYSQKCWSVLLWCESGRDSVPCKALWNLSQKSTQQIQRTASTHHLYQAIWTRSNWPHRYAIDTRYYPTVIFKWIAYLVCCMSKIHILLALSNKKAVTVAIAVNRWIRIYSALDILQSDNGSEFKGVCLELVKSFGVRVINSWPWTPRTQGLIEKANRTVKTRINAWERTHGSSHWSESLDVSYSIYDSTLMWRIFFYFIGSCITNE